MATIQEALTVAFEHHGAGRLEEAEELYRRILDAVPDQPQALHLLGLLRGQSGRLEEAAALMAQAVAGAPGDAGLHAHLAQVLRVLGRLEEALFHYAQALSLDPANEDAADGLAVTAARLDNRRDGDPALLRLAIALRPAYADAIRNLASLEHGRATAGTPTGFLRAARLQPEADALFRLAELHHLRERHRDTAAACRDTLAYAPAQVGAWRHLAHARSALGDRAEATAALRRALAADPHQPELRTALWGLEKALGRRDAHASHEGQDAFVHETFFAHRRDGVFVDVGAYDGETWSNTLFFERTLGWTGLCVEASPTWFPRLAVLRRCPCVNVAVSDAEGTAEFLEIVEGPSMMGGLAAAYRSGQRAVVEALGGAARPVTVPVRRLDTLLAEHGIARVQYCSIDTEGAEAAIVRSLDGSGVTVDVFSLENDGADPALRELMAARGYDFVVRFAGGDEIYARRDLRRP